MEKELRRYFASIISNNLECDVDYTRIQLDPYVLVYLLPTWTSQVTYYMKMKFKNGVDVFEYSDTITMPELEELTDDERKYVIDIYRNELYTVHNIIEYYCNNMIEQTTSFHELFSNMLMDTCSIPTTLIEDHVKINDHGIVYYIPYQYLIDDLVNNININPYTNEPYSNVVYSNMLNKYKIEAKMISKRSY